MKKFNIKNWLKKWNVKTNKDLYNVVISLYGVDVRNEKVINILHLVADLEKVKSKSAVIFNTLER